MRIYHPIQLRASRCGFARNALVDTGAELSMIPSETASAVGAWLTNYSQALTGVHQDTKSFPVVLVDISFPALNVGGRFPFAMSNLMTEVIIGMDVLKPLGISIDTTTSQLSVKNEVWEAFKTLAGIGVLVVGAIKILDSG
jgi:predicted aspartyl protease